ncbi:MAG: hypothetical protein AAGN66_06625 [Acidobacteriota bacterium]
MKTKASPISASEGRIRARRLLKHLRSGSRAEAVAAARRFRRLATLRGRTAEDILDGRGDLRLKHALAVLAVEHGFDGWGAMKAAAEASWAGNDTDALGPRGMYVRGMDVLLNRWFARYEDARASLDEQGGYLLPYEHQCFVCEAEGIRLLGLDPEDPDWARIGWDWAKPTDRAAWKRLRDRRLVAMAG